MLRQRLDEDFVDRYNHFWSPIFFLVLAVAILLGGPSPNFVVSNTYSATCWCPNQFQPSQVAYTHAVCTNIFQDAVRNGNLKTAMPKLSDLGYRSRLPINKNHTKKKLMDVDDQDRPNSELTEYITHTASLTLFLFAIWLNVPFFIWRLVASYSFVDFDRTLHNAVSLVKSSALTKQNRQDYEIKLSTMTAEAVKTRPSFASKVYLGYKLLTCIFVVLELTIAVVLLRMINMSETVIGETESSVRLCGFQIRHITNVHEYTVQCLFTRKDADMKSTGNLGIKNMNGSIEVYNALFLTIVAYFVILLIFDIINLIVRLYKLGLIGNGDHYTRNTELPLDGRLLMSLCMENAGPLVAHGLFVSDVWSKKPESKNGSKLELEEKV